MSDKVVVHLGRKLLRVGGFFATDAWGVTCFWEVLFLRSCDPGTILVYFLNWCKLWVSIVLMFQSGNKKRVYSAMLVTEKNYTHTAWWCFKSKETKSTVFVPNILPLLNLLHFQLLCCFETSMGVVSQLKVSFSS